MDRTGWVTTRRRRRLAATCLAVSLASATLAGVGAAPAGAAGLGPANKATGTPVKIGLITEGGSEGLGSQSALTEQGAEIAVKYANDYLGGLGGHEIELFVCGNQSTPAGGTDCANQMVEQKVVAVVLPFTGQGAAQVPIITGAGIPYVTVSGASSAELTTPGAFVLTGGYPAILAGEAAHAKDIGLKKVVQIVTDVPAATQGAKLLGGIVFKNAGVDYDVVPAPIGTPDLTPQIQAAVDGGADALAMTGDVTFCTSFLKAYQTLGLKVAKYLIATCIDPTVTKTLGNQLKGSYMGTNSPPTKDKDDVVYAAMMKKYAKGKVDPDPTVSTNVAAGVSPVLNLLNAMDGYTGEVTAATVLERFKTAKDVPLWNSGGITFTCDGTAIPILANVCSGDIYMGTLDAKGKLHKLQQYDLQALYKT